jgi:Fe-S-cluster containining protein
VTNARRRKPEPIDDLPSCVSCGACCFQTAPDAIRVFEVDRARMDARSLAFTHAIANGTCLRMEHGHCAALVIDDENSSFVCAIYEQRPDACRAFERGGAACRAVARKA